MSDLFEDGADDFVQDAQHKTYSLTLTFTAELCCDVRARNVDNICHECYQFVDNAVADLLEVAQHDLETSVYDFIANQMVIY